MKTITQIAAEIGVSKQAVQKRISREPLYTCIQPYISTKQGTKYIAYIGVNLIKSAFNKDASIDTIDNVHIDVADNRQPNLYIDVYRQQEEISFLREQNKVLQDELIKEREHSRTQANHIAEQSSRISDLADKMAELTRNNQILLGAEQSRTNPALLNNDLPSEQDQYNEKPKKKNLFDFFKK